jgi:3-deoxy-D-manno-octulosonic-acid transferase
VNSFTRFLTIAFMRLIYNLFIQVYTQIIALYAAFNDKANLWINGRKDWKKKLQEIDFKGHPVYWFHCASLGEFEQGRPLIEEIKSQGNCKILLTFFSPSGYELRKNYKNADWVLYLPADTISNAHFFVKTVQPKAVFFIKYEFWFNYLNELKANDTPVFLISGIFRKDQHFFKWYGSWTRAQLKAFSYFFVQNQSSLELLQQLGFTNVLIAGDTRFDRVLQVMQNNKRFEAIDAFVQHQLIIVAGSTYVDDEKLLQGSFNKLVAKGINFKIILAPHVVSPHRIDEIEALFSKETCLRLSQLKTESLEKKVLIVDNIGMLSALYSYAHIAYIGGGLGKGIHNTLEAAVYSIPLLFGNKYHKFDEAKALVEIGAAFVVNSEEQLTNQVIRLFLDDTVRRNIGRKSSDYVHEQKGALQKIMSELKDKKILL